MYSLGCYSSNLASYGATCRSVSDYGPSSAPYIPEHSELRRASSFASAKRIPESNSSIASARVNKLPAGRLSGTFFVSSLKIPSASTKTSQCSITLSSGASSAESRLPRRQANKKLELVPSSGRNRTDEAMITGNPRLPEVPKKVLDSHTPISNQNGNRMTKHSSSSFTKTMERDQSKTTQTKATFGSLGNSHAISQPLNCAPSSPKVDSDMKIGVSASSTVSFSSDKQQNKTSSSTSLLETSPSAMGALDGLMDSSSSEMKSFIDEGSKCSPSGTSAFENQTWDSKHVTEMMISTSSGPQTVTDVAQEHLPSSSDRENLILAAHAGNSGCSASVKRQCFESEILDNGIFSSTTPIDDQRAENEVAANALTLHPSKRFMSDALGEPTTSFLPGAHLTPNPVSEQQISFSSHLFADQESKLMPTSTDEKQELEFLDSHFAVAETELNSMNLPKLFPVIDIVEPQPVVALSSLSERQIPIGGSDQSNCIDMAEPYIHLKSILKTTTKYPGTTKKTLSIQGAIAWYVSYYWNYSKGAKNSTASDADAVASDGVVHHRTKIKDDRDNAIRDNELADGGYFSDSKPENDGGIPAPMEVVKRVTFAEPMVTTVHHYVGAQRQRRTSPNVKS